jgi:hypothetical protein
LIDGNQTPTKRTPAQASGAPRSASTNTADSPASPGAYTTMPGRSSPGTSAAVISFGSISDARPTIQLNVCHHLRAVGYTRVVAPLSPLGDLFSCAPLWLVIDWAGGYSSPASASEFDIE